MDLSCGDYDDFAETVDCYSWEINDVSPIWGTLIRLLSFSDRGISPAELLGNIPWLRIAERGSQGISNSAFIKTKHWYGLCTYIPLHRHTHPQLCSSWLDDESACHGNTRALVQSGRYTYNLDSCSIFLADIWWAISVFRWSLSFCRSSEFSCWSSDCSDFLQNVAVDVAPLCRRKELCWKRRWRTQTMWSLCWWDTMPSRSTRLRCFGSSWWRRGRPVVWETFRSRQTTKGEIFGPGLCFWVQQSTTGVPHVSVCLVMLLSPLWFPQGLFVWVHVFLKLLRRHVLGYVPVFSFYLRLLHNKGWSLRRSDIQH